jgi:hypothetical protein
MSKKNKQSLLGKTPATTKNKQKIKRQAPSQRSANVAQNPATSININNKPKSKKGGLITLGIIALIILAFPKPTLLTYKKLGMVSESVYWPGLFGYGATIIDSNLYPQLDSRGKSLYLCSDLQNPQSCQKYKVMANNGLFAAIGSYF